MQIKPLFWGVISCILSSMAAAEAPTADQKLGAQGDNQGAQLSYVGSQTRLSIGYDSEFDLVGELYQVLREDSGSAWLGTAWLGNDAGGLQLNYHWLMGGDMEVEHPLHVAHHSFHRGVEEHHPGRNCKQ